MYCAKCGKEMDGTARFCPACGAEASGVATQAAVQEPDTAANADALPEEPSGSGGAVGALVCGIISLVLCWIPFVCIVGFALGIVAVVLGAKAKKNTSKNKKGMAATGFVLGIIALAVSAIMIIVSVVLVSVVGNYGSYLSAWPFDSM